MVPPTKKPRVKLINTAYGDFNKQKEPIPYTPIPRPDLSNFNSSEKFKIIAWNVNGIRSLLRNRPDALTRLWKDEAPDVLGLLEVKIAGPEEIQSDVQSQISRLIGDDVTIFWNPGKVKGYAGTVAILSNRIASRLQHVQFGSDQEGRQIILRFQNTCIILVYTPNSGMHLRRLPLRLKEWDPSLSATALAESQECKNGVFIAGDMNCASRDIDIWNLEHPGILKAAGTTIEERSSFKTCYLERGLKDTFAEMYPNNPGVFSYWSIRAKNRPMNRGLRLDYVLSDSKVPILDAFILCSYGNNGDHCPVGATAKIELDDL